MKKRYRGSGGESLAPSYPTARQFKRRAVLGAAGAALLAGAPMLGCDPFFGYAGVTASPDDLRSDAAIVDSDNDSVAADVDCDDNNPNVFPGNAEVPDCLDNNCNNVIDEGLQCDGGSCCKEKEREDAGTSDGGDAGTSDGGDAG